MGLLSRAFARVASPAKKYAFAGPRELPFYTYVSPGRDANVVFDMAHQTAERGPFGSLGDLSVTEARQVMRSVEAVLREDVQRYGRRSYEMFSGEPKKARLYRRLAEKVEPPPGYFVDTLDPYALYLRQWPEY